MNDGEPQSFKKQLPNDQTSREWWRQQWSFTRKELQETLRDPRTIGTLLLMPLLLYPLLGMVLRFLAIQGVMNPIQEYRIAFENEQTAGIVSSMLQRGEEELAKELPAEDTSKPKSLWRTIVPNKESSFNLADAISAGVADVGVRLDAPINNTETDRSGLRLKIVIAKDYGISRTAGTIVRERLRAFSLLMVTSINEDINHPSPGRVEQSVQYVPMLSEDIGILGLLPLVILLLTVTGGVYPAIDLTAGERERDTLETLVALPVPMVRILAAKYVSVLAVTLLTGLVNVFAMTVTGYALGLQSTLLGDAALSPRLVLSFLLVLTVFGAFYSAILLLLASTARSFKEAQAFLIPLMLLSITPAVAVLIPSWRLDGLLSIVPLVNMLLVAKELFEGTIHPLPAFVAVTSTLVYAAAALAVAARRFGSDALVVGGQMSWADVLRRPKSGRDVPAMHTTLLTLGAILPLHFIATGILGQSKTWSPSSRLMASAIFTALLFGGLPASVVWWNRLQWRATFRLYVPSLLVFPAAILLGVATWPWIHEVVLWSRSLGIQVFKSKGCAINARVVEERFSMVDCGGYWSGTWNFRRVIFQRISSWRSAAFTAGWFSADDFQHHFWFVSRDPFRRCRTRTIPSEYHYGNDFRMAFDTNRKHCSFDGHACLSQFPLTCDGNKERRSWEDCLWRKCCRAFASDMADRFSSRNQHVSSLDVCDKSSRFQQKHNGWVERKSEGIADENEAGACYGHHRAGRFLSGGTASVKRL